MWLSPSMVLMFLSILTSIFMVVSSPSLFISWVGLELNTLAFLPIMLSKKIKMTSEATIKYFLTQTLASILVILSAIFLNLNMGVLGSIFVTVGLGVKLGAAPFHSWILSVAESMGWATLFVLLTIQKFNPLFILWSFLEGRLGLLYIMVIVSLVVGSLLGLLQTSSRLLLTFSSINHMGWLLGSILLDVKLMVVYFLVYIIVLLPVIMVFSAFNISHINELSLVNLDGTKQALLFFSLLSLGGLPPFLGFLPKWLLLQTMIDSSWYFLSLVMILTSLFTLFFYLRVTFSAFILNTVKPVSFKKFQVLSNLNLIFLALSVMGLPVFLFV